MKKDFQNESEDILTIKNASERDIPSILLIQSENLIHNLKKEGLKNGDLEKKGFLIYSLSEKDLEGAIKHPECHVLFVCKKREEVSSYILGYDLNQWLKYKQNWFTNLLADEGVKKYLKNHRILYLRHVAKKRTKKNSVAEMEEKFFEYAKKLGYEYSIAEILEKPIKNLISVTVHQKRGFERIGEILDGEYTWGLFGRKLS